MKGKKSCTDCLWCKINRSKGYIRCIVTDDDSDRTFSHWMNDDRTERIVKLRMFEIKKPFVEWRDCFKLAEKCSSMKSMI